MQTCPCNEAPLTSHFYKVKLGCTGVYIYFLIFALKHRLWVLVRTASLTQNVSSALPMSAKSANAKSSKSTKCKKLGSPCCVLKQDTFTSQKVLVIRGLLEKFVDTYD